MTEGKHFAPRGPAPDDPYRDCAVYLAHGACVCSTGYPSACQMWPTDTTFALDTSNRRTVRGKVTRS